MSNDREETVKDKGFCILSSELFVNLAVRARTILSRSTRQLSRCLSQLKGETGIQEGYRVFSGKTGGTATELTVSSIVFELFVNHEALRRGAGTLYRNCLQSRKRRKWKGQILFQIAGSKVNSSIPSYERDPT